MFVFVIIRVFTRRGSVTLSSHFKGPFDCFRLVVFRGGMLSIVIE